MAQPLEDDTLEKIHSYVKDMDINGTYVDMTEQLLMYRPENPILSWSIISASSTSSR